MTGGLLLPLMAFYQAGDPADSATARWGSDELLPQRFHQALRDEYLSLAARQAQSLSDWTDSQYFALKALQADRGVTPQPERLSDWWLPAHSQLDLSEARARLVSLFSRGGPVLAPDEAARAQATFDCWVERQEENWDAARVVHCRDQFETAMVGMTAMVDAAR